MFWKILIVALFVYFLIRFIIRFVIPLFKIANAAQHSMQEMKKKMEQMDQKSNINPKSNASTQKVEGEYIDYEEVS